MIKKAIMKLSTVLSNIVTAIKSLFYGRRKDIVLFGAWFGDKFSDNSRFLFQYLSDNKEKHGLSHVVWVTRDEKTCKTLEGMGYEVYMMDSEESKYYHKKAKTHIICNCSSYKSAKLPDILTEYSYGAKRINLWHGVGVIKGVGCASLEYKKKKEAHRFVYACKELLERLAVYRLFAMEKGGWGSFKFLSTTPAATYQFAQFSYVPKKNFIESAYPRTCECPKLTPDEEKVVKIIESSKNTVLYLPTFRTGDNKFDFTTVADSLKDTLQKNDILFIQKAHSASAVSTEYVLEGNVLSLSPDFDINVIIPKITMLITDYSSAMSDAAFFHKPVLLYVPDFEEYVNGDNGVTDEAEELMNGPKFYNITELAEGIERYIASPDSAKPECYEAVREKYWGKERTLEEIWTDIETSIGLKK